jgi:uncharacterized protein YegL
MGNSLGPNMNANSGNYNYFSGWAKVSFDGFINENYFQVSSQERNLVQNIEISHAFTKNPITNQKDAFISLILKSKYDGIGNRQPIDISIALDISGSMSCIDGNDAKSRLTLAKESLKKLVSIMDLDNDKMSLITFNHKTQKIFELLNKNDIQQKFLSDIDSIKANGGTDLFEALKAAMNNLNMENVEKKEKRIIMITDAAYKDVNNSLLNLFKQCVEEKGVSITIMAISSESNLSLADKLSHFKGCNYFPITKSSDLETFLVKDFNYIFFPIAYDTKIKINSNVQILKCVGGENTMSDEYMNIDNKDEAPKPSNEVSFDFGSAFSSDLLKIRDNLGEEKFYSRGGLILLKINPDDLYKNEELKFDFILEYKSFDNKTCSQNYSYSIGNKNDIDIEYFCNNSIRKGISIYYFSNILNHIVETFNKGNYNDKYGIKDENKKQKDLKLLETKQVVSEYLRNNFILEPDNQDTKQNLNNYLKLMEERYDGFKKIVFQFYNLNAAPMPYINQNYNYNYY